MFGNIKALLGGQFFVFGVIVNHKLVNHNLQLSTVAAVLERLLLLIGLSEIKKQSTIWGREQCEAKSEEFQQKFF